MSAVPQDHPVDMRLAARWWAGQGVPVIPLHHPKLTPNLDWACSCGKPDCGSPAKHPIATLTPNGLKNGTTDLDTIDRWWNQHPEANIGLLTGVTFDLLDIDGPTGIASLEQVCKDLGGKPQAICTIVSGRAEGGRHYYVTPPALGTFSGGKRGVPAGIDCKSAGGYVVAPPSQHISGSRYRIVGEYGTQSGDIPWPKLHDHLTTQAQAEQAAEFAGPAAMPTPVAGGFSEAVLARLLDEMRSAVSGHRWDTMAMDVAYDLARAIAGGTLDDTHISVVQQAASAAGLTQAEVDRLPKLVADALPTVTTPIVATKTTTHTVTVVPTTPDKADQDWPHLEPLTEPVPDFPMDVLGPLEGPCNDLAEEMQCPPDLVGMMVLATLAAVVRGRLRVQVTDTWTEPLNLYIAVVLAAGETKSPVLARVTEALREIEAELAEEAAPYISAAQQAVRIQDGRVKKAERAAMNAEGDELLVAANQAKVEQDKLDALEVPASPRLIVGDITPEALVQVLGEQHGAIASITAEGGLFDTLAGRYSRGVANLDAVLQAHDGREPILVDRKGADPIRVDNPCLTLGLAVQPQVLEAIGENEAASGRGLLARFLYSVPASRVGTRDMSRTRPSRSSGGIGDLIRSLDAVLRGLRPSFGDFGDMSLIDNLKLSSLSIDVLTAYRIDLEPRRHPFTGDLADVQAWTNKLDGQIVRLAGLLSLISQTPIGHVPNVPKTLAGGSSGGIGDLKLTVEPENIWSAIRLADYLIEHARAAHVLMSPTGGTLGPARQLLGWAVDRGERTFTTREAQQALKRRVAFRHVEAVKAAALTLHARGFIRAIADTEPATPGRPTSQRWILHPDAARAIGRMTP